MFMSRNIDQCVRPEIRQTSIHLPDSVKFLGMTAKAKEDINCLRPKLYMQG